jgi:hypothetical protein
MSVPEDPFDFAALLRRDVARAEQARPPDDGDWIPAISPALLQPIESQPKAAHPADTLAPNPVPSPIDATTRTITAPTATLSVTYRRLMALWPASFRLPRAADAPLFGIVSGGAAFILIVGTIIVSLVQHGTPRTSDPETDLSGPMKLASINSRRVETPAMQETTLGAGSSNAVTPASRDNVDSESKQNSVVNPPEGVPPVIPASIKTPASPENAPPSELPKLAAMYSQPAATQPIPLPPIPPPGAQRGASPSRAATETTASLSPTTPPSEPKAALPRAEATPPHSDDAPRRKRDQKPGAAGETPIPPVPPAAQRNAPPSRAAAETTASIAPNAPPSGTKTTAPQAEATPPHNDETSQRKRDQKPGNAVETSSCTANVIPGSVRASARAKSGQADVQRMCADPNVPFTISVRCLVAAVCSDYPSEKQGKVAQKATATNRAPSHAVTDTKPETKSDLKPEAKSH